MKPREALQAIAALINGAYDAPALVRRGALSVDSDADILAWAQEGLKGADDDKKLRKAARAALYLLDQDTPEWLALRAALGGK